MRHPLIADMPQAGSTMPVRAMPALRAVLQGAVGECHDADQALVAIDHRQTAQLEVAHVLDDVLDVLVVEAVFHVRCHGIAYRRGAAFFSRHRANRNIAVGDAADQTITVTNRQKAYIAVRHDPGDDFDGIVRMSDADVPAHDFGYPHCACLMLEMNRRRSPARACRPLDFRRRAPRGAFAGTVAA